MVTALKGRDRLSAKSGLDGNIARVRYVLPRAQGVQLGRLEARAEVHPDGRERRRRALTV